MRIFPAINIKRQSKLRTQIQGGGRKKAVNLILPLFLKILQDWRQVFPIEN